MGSNHKTNKTLAEKWLGRIEEYTNSGQTKSEYSKSNGFPAHQLSYWIHRLEEKLGFSSNKNKPTFVPVQVEPTPSSSTPKPYCQLSFNNGGVISVENELGFTKLCELITAE